jgi:hypothetical protein
MAVRRVRRIIRRIDPWTVLKVSLVFNAIAALIFVLGTWVMWSLALRRGIPERVVDIFESLTLTITIEGELYFRIVVLLAIIGAILATAFMTLGAVLYNLIADLVGGVEVAVLEETYRPAATRTRMTPVAESPAAGAQPAEQARVTEAPAPVPRAPEWPPEAPDVETDSPVEIPIVTPREPVDTPAAAASDEEAAPGDEQGDAQTAEEADPRVRAG